MMDTIGNILLGDSAFCAAAKTFASCQADMSAAIHQANVARALGDLEGWLKFARAERSLMAEAYEALVAQADAGIAAVERWLGPAPTVAQGETP